MSYKNLAIAVCIIFSNIVIAQRSNVQLRNIPTSKSLHFDGKNDFIKLPNPNRFAIHRGTLEAWIKIEDTTYFEWHSIITKELSYQITLYGYKLATYDWKLRKGYVYGKSLNDSQWHHVAFVFQDSVINGSQLYLDGAPIGDPITYNIFLPDESTMEIGANHFTDQYFNGWIDEVRIWNKPLTAAEIKKNNRTEISALSPNLLLYYKFSDGVSQGNNANIGSVKDETLNGNDGVLYNFSLKGATSNFVSDTVVLLYNENILLKFFVTYRWIIFWVLLTFLCGFIVYRFRVKYLLVQNKKLEIIVEERTKQLAQMLDEKDVLIQEIHHRVKNNLQFMLSIIDMQMMLNKHNDNNALNDVSRRLTAMALVHELLYRQDDLEKISTKVYFDVFVQNIEKMIENKALVVDSTIEDIVFNVSQCMSIGMIISELVSNSVKYAFINQEHPVINIHLMHSKTDNNLLLHYKDNGIGFDVDNNSKGLGSTLIDVFSKQLHGSYQYSNNNGSSFTLQFSI